MSDSDSRTSTRSRVVEMLSAGDWTPQAQLLFAVGHVALTWSCAAYLIGNDLPASPMLLITLPVLVVPLVCPRWVYLPLCVNATVAVSVAMREVHAWPLLANSMRVGMLVSTIIGCELIRLGICHWRRLVADLESRSKRFRTILEQGMDIVAVIDAEGDVVYSSASFPRILGKSPNEPNPQRIFNIHPADRDRVTALWDRSLREPGHSIPISLRLKHPEGGYIELEGHITNYFDLDAIGGMLIVVRDVSQRESARRSVATRDVLLQSAERLAKVGSWVWEIPTGEVQWSDEAYRIMRVARDGEPRSALNFLERVVPEDREKIVRAVQSQLETGESETLTFRIDTAEGGTLHIALAMDLERDDSGDPVRFVGTFYDVSQHKAAEEALAASEGRLLEAQRIGRLGSWEIDLDSGERWWSREAIRVACGPGVEEPPSFGTLLRDHVHVHDRERLIETVNECIRLGTPAETSFRVHHSDGDERYLHARIRVAQRSRERVTRLAGTVQDITSQRRVEAELERHRNNLEELVDDRTRELEQSQAALARSQRLASLGTLAAGMAHQINNPVGGILLAAESALMCAPRDPHGSDSRDDALRDIAVQARRCGSIVRSILTFSHGNPVDKAVSDLRTTVEDAFRAVAGFAERRSAKLRLELANVTLPVRMNPIEIEQVIINLVHNAIESRETGVSVCINGRRLDGHVIVEVHDDGPGIAAPELAHVFDPFYTTRLEQGGTGLGLSVAHGIAIDHGGCLELDSRLNQGTVARLSLPLCARKPEEMKEGSN